MIYKERIELRNLIVIGAGGYAKSVVDSVDFCLYEIKGFIDDYKDDEEHLGYPILGKNLDCVKNPEGFFYFVAIGNNEKRTKWYKELKSKNLQIINIIDSSAMVSDYAKFGKGCFIGKMAIVNSKAVIGDNCIINTKALVEHGCHIESHVNISTNTVLNGDVCVGEMSFVGSGSIVNGQITIGENVTIGSGSVVINDVEDDTTVVGVPAKVIKKGGKRV